MRSTRRVASGATLRKTETVPRVLCFIASIDDPSIAEKRKGTVHPHLEKARADGRRGGRGAVVGVAPDAAAVTHILMVVVVGAGSCTPQRIAQRADAYRSPAQRTGEDLRGSGVARGVGRDARDAAR